MTPSPEQLPVETTQKLMATGHYADGTKKNLIMIKEQTPLPAQVTKIFGTFMDNQVTVSIPVTVGEEDRLYGSVTTRDIAEALHAKGVELDAKKLALEEPIKSLGLTEVVVKLGQGVSAKIKVWVVKKE